LEYGKASGVGWWGWWSASETGNELQFSNQRTTNNVEFIRSATANIRKIQKTERKKTAER
jgi:hypothetical protein